MMVDFIPPYQATVAANLRRAGLPVLGKTNLDDLLADVTESSAFTHLQPRDRNGSRRFQRRPAAAVAAGMAPWPSVPTQSSVRLPAAFAG